MSDKKVYRAIGCMSGTSVDAIDIALIETNGHGVIKPLAFKSYPYTSAERSLIKSRFGSNEPAVDVSRLITQKHIEALEDFNVEADVIGFHGQTIFHDPNAGKSIQVGNPHRIAQKLGIRVVGGLRQNDLAKGGQGAPLLPIYHFARCHDASKPLAILNLGGVGNITYIPSDDMGEMVAFDTGPGNALMDDYCAMFLDAPFDKDGGIAEKGAINGEILEQYLAHDYFDQDAPKSLDRDMWGIDLVDGLTPEDALATLLAFTVSSVQLALMSLEDYPTHIYVSGGGRLNKNLMAQLTRALAVPIQPVEELGWNGDALEAEGFAYMAVRSLLNLPITFPSTTGCQEPLNGGVVYGPS